MKNFFLLPFYWWQRLFNKTKEPSFLLFSLCKSFMNSVYFWERKDRGMMVCLPKIESIIFTGTFIIG
jgi:hypothetical protein